ncbi:MAG: hypothetical protein KAS17_04115 [Victivallaceae bacterium]|nr:hypothetical protein [Victivallaceae bacterium]
MHKIFLLLLMLVFSVTVFAQAPVKRLTAREKIILKINREVEDDTVIEVLRKYNNDIRGSIKDKKPLSALTYYSFASAINNRFIKYHWFIADTGLSKKWLKNVHELLAYMSKTQGYIKSAKFSGHTKTAEYQQAVKYFDLAYERFVKKIQKPVKVSSKLKRQSQAKKVMWQKGMRKKYKIKEKMKAEF